MSRRALRYESRASFWLLVAITLLVLGMTCGWVALWACLSGVPTLAVGAAMLGVICFGVAIAATDHKQTWKQRAVVERQFETIETLSSPRWHAASNNNNDNNQ